MLQDSNQVLAFLVSGWTFAWPTALLAIIWIAWLASWVAASFWSARTQKQVLTAEASTYRIPIFAGGILFTPWLAQAFGIQPLWRFGTPGILVFALLTLAGISFTWWARIHLGRFWSNTITRKEDHRVIDTGPYGFVRHPIYTGLIAGMLATGVAVGTVTSMLGAVLISLGMWQKARLEEGFLTTELGAEAYGLYRKRVPMLVPFLPGG